MSTRFKIGDRVLIREDSKHFTSSERNPMDVEGVIIEFKFDRNDYTIRVKWDNGYKNVYRDIDLKPVIPYLYKIH